MRPGTTGRRVALLACGILLATVGAAAAQTTTTKPTTTTTTSTTTTTLLPHPFSEATAKCVRAARGARSACHAAGTGNCFSPYQTAFSNCFAAGAGVKCATKCTGNETTCFGKLPVTRMTCRKACVAARAADELACRRIPTGESLWAGGDASCVATADANLDLCRAVCAGAAVDCRTALKFCIANCPNL